MSDTENRDKSADGGLRTTALFCPLVEAWKRHGEELHRVQKLLSDVTGSCPDSLLNATTWGMFAGYTKALSSMMGDEDGWLEWFAWECDFGKNAKEMQFSDGEKLMVVGVEDLLDAIMSHPDGTRNHSWQNS